ncbi:response regulator transcription factor [Agriterribacter sp.]|uniref:response regulator transcription factor n=1 Tax=Agriterribacter sp. TaxID=2821509 RepID=UPI002BAF2D79|nr:response regulator transcription factor [Agriterribacter sp.]HRP56538.1 response regulator transcription factor [Agriterribacter sp.]
MFEHNPVNDKITILIVDDHKLIRDTWSFILNSDPRFQVIAETDSGKEAIELAENNRPHIVLMDINMSPMNGFEATKEIRKVSPDSKIIGVSMHSQPAYAKKMLQVGAMGYITKNSSKEEMIGAISEVAQGNKYICHEVKAILSEQILEDNEKPDINLLSQREIEIIELIKQGQSSKEIAQQLNITLKTVEVHRHNILKKLNLKNTAALVNFINNAGVA